MQFWLLPKTALDHAVIAYIMSGPEVLASEQDLPRSADRIALQEAIIAMAARAPRTELQTDTARLHLAATCNPALQALIPGEETISAMNSSRVSEVLQEDPYRFIAMVDHGLRLDPWSQDTSAVIAAARLLCEEHPLAGKIAKAVRIHGRSLLSIPSLARIVESLSLSSQAAITLISDLITDHSKNVGSRQLTLQHVEDASDLACVIYALLGYQVTDGAEALDCLRGRLMHQASSNHGRLRLTQHFGSVSEVIEGFRPNDLPRRMAQYTRDGMRAKRRAEAHAQPLA